MTFDAAGVREEHFGGPDRAITMTPASSALRRDLAAALDEIDALRAAAAASAEALAACDEDLAYQTGLEFGRAEGARLSAECGLAGEGA